MQVTCEPGKLPGRTRVFQGDAEALKEFIDTNNLLWSGSGKQAAAYGFFYHPESGTTYSLIKWVKFVTRNS